MTMTVTFIFVLAGLLALSFLMRLAKVRGLANRRGEDTAGQIRPVDVEAFRNLIDPAEAQFLRSNLPPPEFRRVERQRLRAAVEYISCAAYNAKVLMRMGETARNSPEPAVAEAGEKLVNTAIRLRVYAFQVTAKLYLRMVFPGAQFAPVGLAENYERMTGLVLLLGRMENARRNVSSAL
jgi:hypothetical protein